MSVVVLLWNSLLLFSATWSIASAQDYEFVGDGLCQDGSGKFLTSWMREGETVESCKGMCSKFAACVSFDAEEIASRCTLRFGSKQGCLDMAAGEGATNTESGKPWSCTSFDDNPRYSGFTLIGKEVSGRKCYEKISKRLFSPICGKCGCSVCRPNARFQSTAGSVDWCRSPEKHPDDCPAGQCECEKAASTQSQEIAPSKTDRAANQSSTAKPAADNGGLPAEPQQNGMSGGLLMIIAVIAGGSCGLAVLVILCFGLQQNSKSPKEAWSKPRPSTMWELEKQRRQPTMLEQVNSARKHFRAQRLTAVEAFQSQELTPPDLELNMGKVIPPTPSTTSTLGSLDCVQSVSSAETTEVSPPLPAAPAPPHHKVRVSIDTGVTAFHRGSWAKSNRQSSNGDVLVVDPPRLTNSPEDVFS